jgi:DNA-binding LacI/PurR family transcriptional regulator
VHDPRRMELSVRRMIERRVDGVAILTIGMEDTLLEHFTVREVPLVFVDVGPDRPHVANIHIDYQTGIRQAVQHLAALRHTRIAFVTGPLHLKSATARKDGVPALDGRDRASCGQPRAGRPHSRRRHACTGPC